MVVGKASGGVVLRKIVVEELLVSHFTRVASFEHPILFSLLLDAEFFRLFVKTLSQMCKLEHQLGVFTDIRRIISLRIEDQVKMTIHVQSTGPILLQKL